MTENKVGDTCHIYMTVTRTAWLHSYDKSFPYSMPVNTRLGLPWVPETFHARFSSFSQVYDFDFRVAKICRPTPKHAAAPQKNLWCKRGQFHTIILLF